MAGRDTERRALAGLLRETRAARIADRLPAERRKPHGLLISIGMGEDKYDDPDAEVHGIASDDDPVLPGRVRPGGADPNAEIYGEADDDDPELKGRIRR